MHERYWNFDLLSIQCASPTCVHVLVIKTFPRAQNCAKRFCRGCESTITSATRHSGIRFSSGIGKARTGIIGKNLHYLHDSTSRCDATCTSLRIKRAHELWSLVAKVADREETRTEKKISQCMEPSKVKLHSIFLQTKTVNVQQTYIKPS